MYRFGRRVGRGGMGQVYLGLQEGAGGLERFVVIKRIYPHLVEDEHFTRMLLEEARLAGSLGHPNVVQILDIGHSADGYFIVMEYLSGETLFFITRTLHARGEKMPPSVACRIVAEVAAGLHSAHIATDPAGQPQPIVHRDVTPSNLIVCFNGVVKIVDFGVAKAILHEGQTHGGVKGKMSYLAPEQLDDKPLDGRADLFQLGICLHELLTGTRLFKGDSDQQRVMAVLHQRIPPPSELMPNLPKELDEVVLWALERDPERRPATADDFRRALELAAADVGVVSGHDLGGWMRSALADRLAERTRFERHCMAEMREERSHSGEMSAAGLRAASSSGAEASGGDSSGNARSDVGVSLGADSTQDSGSFLRTPAGGVGFGLSPPPPGEDESRPGEGESRPRHQSGHGGPRPGTGWTRWIGGFGGTWRFLGLAVLMVLTAFGIAFVVNAGSRSTGRRAGQGQGATAHSARLTVPQAEAPAGAAPTPATTEAAGAAAAAQAPATPPPPPRTFEVVVSVDPARATVELDGVEVAHGSYRTTLPVDRMRHIMKVHADGFGSVEFEFTDGPPPSRIRLDPVRAILRRDRPAAAAKPVRRGSAPEAGRKRMTMPPARADDDTDDYGRDDGAMSDIPDPWAADIDAHPEGPE